MRVLDLATLDFDEIIEFNEMLLFFFKISYCEGLSLKLLFWCTLTFELFVDESKEGKSEDVHALSCLMYAWEQAWDRCGGIWWVE